MLNIYRVRFEGHRWFARRKMIAWNGRPVAPPFFCCEVVSGIQKVSERYSVLGSDAHLLIGVILAKKFCERFHRFDVYAENLESR